MKSALQKGIPQSLMLNRNDISDFFDTLRQVVTACLFSFIFFIWLYKNKCSGI